MCGWKSRAVTSTPVRDLGAPGGSGYLAESNLPSGASMLASTACLSICSIALHMLIRPGSTSNVADGNRFWTGARWPCSAATVSFAPASWHARSSPQRSDQSCAYHAHTSPKTGSNGWRSASAGALCVATSCSEEGTGSCKIPSDTSTAFLLRNCRRRIASRTPDIRNTSPVTLCGMR